MITIGDPGGSTSVPDDPAEICLPPVLQDRKRTPSATFGAGNRITLTPDPAPDFPPSIVRKPMIGSSNRPDVVATCAAVATKLASNVNGKKNDAFDVFKNAFDVFNNAFDIYKDTFDVLTTLFYFFNDAFTKVPCFKCFYCTY